MRLGIFMVSFLGPERALLLLSLFFAWAGGAAFYILHKRDFAR